MSYTTDELLSAFGLKWEDLDTAGHTGEREEVMKRLSVLQTIEDISVDSIKRYLAVMRDDVEHQLVKKRDRYSLTSLLTYFIPIIGLIHQWYQDQYEVELRARLANYIDLERMLLAPENQRKQIEKDLRNIKRQL